MLGEGSGKQLTPSQVIQVEIFPLLKLLEELHSLEGIRLNLLRRTIIVLRRDVGHWSQGSSCNSLF